MNGYKNKKNSENLLFDLSSRVQSLNIIQTLNLRPDENRLFGISSGDWASIILTMFSNKLDTLSIHDENERVYLNDSNVATLQEVSRSIDFFLFLNSISERELSIIFKINKLFSATAETGKENLVFRFVVN